MCKRKVDQYEKNGDFIKTWDSVTEAARSIGIGASTFLHIFDKNRNIAYDGGYNWKYHNTDIEGEVWRKHPEYDIECSDKGRIRRNKRIPTYGYLNKKSGYRKFDIGKKTGIRSRAVHRLIMETFDPVGELITMYQSDHKPQVDHINGIESDNRLDNLQWLTPKDHNNKTRSK